MSTPPGSITHWIARLKAGDAAAAQRLWEGFYARLVALARRKLRGAPRTVSDEDDVALSAFDSFCRAAEQGRFPQLADRDSLWRLLIVITERKAMNQVQHERRIKRGGGKVCHAGALEYDSGVPAGLDRFPAAEPTPAVAAQVAEECRRLLDALNDDTLRSIAVAKMEGHTNAEIADRLQVSLPTVERKLQRIRLIWEKEMGQ